MGVLFFCAMGAESMGVVRTAVGRGVRVLFSPGEICYVTDNVCVSNISTFDHIADYVRFTKFPQGKTLRRRRAL
jgi:hypothetical protein